MSQGKDSICSIGLIFALVLDWYNLTGEHGRNVHLVRSEEEVLKIVPNGFGTDWLLQELISGTEEFAVSLLVRGGLIADAISTKYEYNQSEYVWPHNVQEVATTPSAEHAAAHPHARVGCHAS